MGYGEVTPSIITALKSIVGERYVSDNPALCASYVSKSVMGLESVEPDVVVRPRYVEEVRKILMLANEHRIPVTPMCGGLSGGYACPLIEPGGILLDLGRMNRILEVNTDARYAVVEPGVTTGYAWAYMRKYYPDWCIPIPDGAPPAATVVGDILERGFSLITTRYGPQAEYVMDMEIVLPNGDVVYTGAWALPGAKPFYRWGLGPSFFGAFMGSQGTMGVITKMAVKIFPHPEHKDIIAFGFESPEDLADFTLEVCKKEIGHMVQGGNIWLVPTRLTWEKATKDMISEQFLGYPTVEFWKKVGVPEWFMNFEIWGFDEEHLEWQRKTIYKLAEEFRSKGRKVEEWKLAPHQKKTRLTKPNKIAIPYAIYRGSFLFITWYLPWKDVPEILRISEEKMKEYGFPPVLWVAAIEHARQAIFMPIVCFDPTNPDEIERLYEFNRDTTEIFVEKGWINYRPDPFIHAPAMFHRGKAYYEYLKKLKKIFDPNGIMHPGRLCLP